MVEATGLKLWLLGYIECHALSIEFQEELSIGSKVVWEGQTHRQKGDLISLLIFFLRKR
jgi:hypothetical protein